MQIEKNALESYEHLYSSIYSEISMKLSKVCSSALFIQPVHLEMSSSICSSFPAFEKRVIKACSLHHVATISPCLCCLACGHSFHSSLFTGVAQGDKFIRCQYAKLFNDVFKAWMSLVEPQDRHRSCSFMNFLGCKLCSRTEKPDFAVERFCSIFRLSLQTANQQLFICEVLVYRKYSQPLCLRQDWSVVWCGLPLSLGSPMLAPGSSCFWTEFEFVTSCHVAWRRMEVGGPGGTIHNLHITPVVGECNSVIILQLLYSVVFQLLSTWKWCRQFAKCSA